MFRLRDFIEFPGYIFTISVVLGLAGIFFYFWWNTKCPQCHRSWSEKELRCSTIRYVEYLDPFTGFKTNKFSTREEKRVSYISEYICRYCLHKWKETRDYKDEDDKK